MIRDIRNRTQTGIRTEAVITAELLKRYDAVLAPFGGGRRYDLVVDHKGTFIRIQCKTGWICNDVVMFKTTSSFRSYIGEVEYIAVWCPENDKVYLIPVEETGGGVSLRLTPPRNNQKKFIRYAQDYEIDNVPL